MTGCAALIVAAGRGHRLGGERPKQYMPLGGKAVLRHAAEAFASHPKVDITQIVIHPDDRVFYDEAVAGLALPDPVAGGETRQESVRLGLERLNAQAPTTVLIHDAARPFIDAATIARVVDALAEERAAIAALPVVDTLKREEGSHIAATVDRSGLWRAQTPQGFRFPDILAAYRSAKDDAFTDDAAVAEAAGIPVGLVGGTEANFKVTTTEDFARAERLASGATGLLRVGQGFDLHRFGPGDHVMICGVSVPHDRGIEAHSDGDVGLHALTDAILGAIGDGDIGTHFPPSDPKWRSVDSAVFLHEALTRLAQRGGRIHNLDVTLICEEPKITPHRKAMVARLAAITGLAENAISVKATTTEGLGFLGRKEAIAAQAVAMIALPA
ncbi:MAG: bifunctional 2-C-methyl-D-erythritol 4-phosphate cytidylyltransferase/2-C-methyl-D-erythritol 2,4-cyclodiphosphate synthase [Alphaproteobacteria bacterium]|nr:bifunctional 2-C-methyl-D-erythritol 4-phosphate cytidylyltransferase/2-C-methyl-D-erythritol 2,4-cyclodiphosphate synthase [Alphaproteobacteria bacterium]